MTFHSLNWYWNDVRMFLTLNKINPDTLSLVEQEIYYLTWGYGQIEQIIPIPYSQN